MEEPFAPPLSEHSDTPPSPPPLPAAQPIPMREMLRNARRHGCLQGCLVSAAVLFFLTIVLPGALFLLAAREASKGLSGVRAESLFGGSKSDEDDGFSGDASGLREVWVDDWTRPGVSDDAMLAKAVRIPLAGTIDLGEDSFGEEGAAATALRAIRRATQDSSVDAILLLVDSGGGGITASDILYDALVKFREEREDRRIVALMGDMACSGAYYASLPADRILAHPTTITGSIGVILPSINVRQLADRIGIVDDSIQSGDNKAMLNPMRELTDAQRAMLQGTVDELHARFTGLVAKHRGIAPKDVAALADGRIYTARQALALKLIDGLGYLDDAESAVVDVLDAKNGVAFYEYEHKLSLRDLLATPSFWGAALRRVLPAAVEAVPARPLAK